MITFPWYCATVILEVRWDNKETLPSSSKFSGPFHCHPPLPSSSLVPAGFSLLPVNGTASSVQRKHPGSALKEKVLRKQDNVPLLPNKPIIHGDGSFPRNSSGKPAPQQLFPAPVFLAQGAQTASCLSHHSWDLGFIACAENGQQIYS